MTLPPLTLLKIGGKVVEAPEALHQLLNEFGQLDGSKILVHGGGRSATQLAEQLGLQATLVNGRRITDADMLDIVLMVFAGRVNKQMVALLQAQGLNAVGLCGADLNLIRAHKRPPNPIDFGFVGDVDEVNHAQLHRLLDTGALPVIAPITHDGQGQLLNTNADTMASVVAQALAPFFHVRLVLCFEKPGVLLDPTDDASVIPQLTPSRYRAYRSQGIIADGMLPKLDNAFDALRAGVAEVYVCDKQGLSRLDRDFPGTRVQLSEAPA